jgi:hypothetical protein
VSCVAIVRQSTLPEKSSNWGDAFTGTQKSTRPSSETQRCRVLPTCDDPSFPDEGLLVLQQLPQRFGLQVSGPQFSDASLNYLKKAPNLVYLVVVDTNATDEGLSQLKRMLPHVDIMHGYYGDPDFRVVK